MSKLPIDSEQQIDISDISYDNCADALSFIIFRLNTELDNLYKDYNTPIKKHIYRNYVFSANQENLSSIANTFHTNMFGVQHIQNKLIEDIRNIACANSEAMNVIFNICGGPISVNDNKCYEILKKYYIVLNKLSSDTCFVVDINARKLIRVQKIDAHKDTSRITSKKVEKLKPEPEEKIKIDKDTETQVNQARKKLLDLTMKNSLLNFKHSERSLNQLRIVDSNVNALYNDLSIGKSIELLPLPELPSEPSDEKLPKFKNAFEIALVTDSEYLSAKEELDKRDDVEDEEEEKLIRELKNRVREKLGWPPVHSVEKSKREWAKENNINPDYDNDVSDKVDNIKSNKHTSQTLLYPKEFNSKISGLKRIIKSDREEKGTNTFYVAFGFLEWYEQTTSSTKHLAPLLLLKLEDLNVNKQRNKVTFLSAGDPIIINLSLKEKLKDFNLQLPEYDEDDTPTHYFEKVSKRVSSQKRWKVHSYITIGRFIFSRLAMYEDLKLENWASKLVDKDDLLKALFDSKTRSGNSDYSYDIDKDEDVIKYAPILITSADSSQHSAIIDVMKDNDLVIKGPPGTGKSQTITNLIANALYSNKRVLFMAEKKAALDVVFSRLREAGLEDYCFELHSDKTNMNHVRSGLSKSLDRYKYSRFTTKSISKEKISRSISEKKRLREYYDTLQNKVCNIDKSLFDLAWGVKNLDYLISSAFPTSIKNIKIRDVSKINSNDFDKDVEKLCNLEKLYTTYKHSIEGLGNVTSCKITGKEVYSLLNDVENIIEDIDNLEKEKAEYSINRYIHVPDDLPSSKDLFENTSECLNYIKDKKINANWLLVAETNNIFDSISRFCEYLKEYRDLYSNASSLCNDPSFAYDNDDKYNEIYKNLQDQYFQNYTLRDTLKLKPIIDAEIQQWDHSDRLREVASLIYKKEDLSIGDICSIKDILNEFCKVSDILPLYARNMEMFKPYNWSILDKAEDEIITSRKSKDELSQTFDIDSILDISDIENQLSNAINSISNVGFFRIFDREYKRAIKFYKSIALNAKVKKNVKLENLKLLLKYVKHYNKLSNNNSFIDVIGSYFAGADTEIGEIQKIHNFYKILFSLENAYGKDRFEFLNNYFSSKENFNDLQRISNFASTFNNFELSFNDTDINQSYEDYVCRLKQIKSLIYSLTDEFVELFKADDIVINRILDNRITLQSLKQLKEQICQLSADISQFLPDLAVELNSDIGAIDNLLQLKHIIESNKHICAMRYFIDAVADNELEDIFSIIERYYKKMSYIIDEMASVKQLFIFNGEKYENNAYKDFNLSDLSEYLLFLLGHRDAIYNVCAFYEALKQVKNNRYDIIIEYLQDHNIELYHLSDIYKYLVYYNLVSGFNNDIWDSYIPKELETLTSDIRNLDSEIYKLNVQLLTNNLNNIVVPQGNNSIRVSEKTELQLIEHQLNGHARNIPLRQFIKKAGRAVLSLKPCFLMSPIAVAQYIPPKSIEFDLLIIDEASQMYFEEALGGILRAKQIVVVGDEHQLPPTPFFQKTVLQEDEFEEDVIATDSSILDMCISRGFDYKELMWHYRSKDGSLIAFSNKNFYNDNLKIFPSPVVSSLENGVQRIYVGGVYKNHINEEEADRIIREIKQFVRTHPDRSLGIATINSSQKALLDKRCDLLYEQDIKFRDYFDKWNNRLESFFVKNLENVQGDERDYIFVSTVYGPEAKGGKVMQRFGPINGVYGHRRLNVLFTRAKYGLKLFTSLKSDDIVVSDTSTIGLKTFHDYLLYAESGRIETGTPSNRGFDSEFEKMVYDILTSKGYEVDKQVGVNGFFIDLAVKHPLNKSYYAVGIECDGAPYHSTKSARDRDCIRQAVLESLGWKIYRIWSKDWFFNTDAEIKKLFNYLEEISKTEPHIEYASNNNAGEDIIEERESNNTSEYKDSDDDYTENDDSDDDFDIFKSSKKSATKRVDVNDKVIYVRLSDNTEHTVQITRFESNPNKGIINVNTGLAQVLLDAEEGEELEINDKVIQVKEIIKH